MTGLNAKTNTPPKKNSENNAPKWDGSAKGSTLGNLIFMKLIAMGGPIPAYILLLFVALYYTLRDHNSIAAIRAYRTNLGLKTRFGHLYWHFVSFGAGLIDGLAYLAAKQSPFSNVCIGEEHLAKALEKGKGLILLSAHIGNWEVSGNQLFENLGTRINIVMLDNEREAIQNVFQKATDRRAVQVIWLDPEAGGANAMIEIRAALARNEIVAIMGDRVLEGMDCLEVPFLGKVAQFPVGPFMIGAITGAPMIAVFALKIGLLRFEHRAYASIDFDGVTRQNRTVRIREGVEKYVGILEDVVRKNPYQWFNFYDYWVDKNGSQP